MKIDDFKHTHLSFYCISWGSASSNFENYPYAPTFLRYAREDLDSCKDLRCAINAVGNAKRALHRRVDKMCESLGYKNTKSSFPSKLEYLGKCGVISPQILSKFNKIRNKIEHEYEGITFEQAEDFVDIIELFLIATGNFLRNYPDSFYGDNMKDEDLIKELQQHYREDLPDTVHFLTDFKNGKIQFSFADEELKIITIEDDDSEYFGWLSHLTSPYFFA